MIFLECPARLLPWNSIKRAFRLQIYFLYICSKELYSVYKHHDCEISGLTMLWNVKLASRKSTSDNHIAAIAAHSVLSGQKSDLTWLILMVSID